jgi:ribonuclease Y
MRDLAEARIELAQGQREIETVRIEASLAAKAAIVEAGEAARAEARSLVLEAQRGLATREDRVNRREQLVVEREGLLAARDVELGRRDASMRQETALLAAQRADAGKLVSQHRARLESLAGLSGDEARRTLLEHFYDDARRFAAHEAKLIEDTAREETDRRAKRIIGIAIQRFASEAAQERAVTSVHLPSDELKGRIIGREGRNIRALQDLCGVDFIVDDTPETIVISCFDPVRREVARLALERLIVDGRIHPTRIEEVVHKAQEDIATASTEAADGALAELGLTRVHPELVKLLGRLRYRYSYAQNVLTHSIEAGFLAGLMAAELGQDVLAARRAGLLHDIGKAVSHEQEGGHASVGAEQARKCGEDAVIVNAIACHHGDEPVLSVVASLVMAADALSGARPGARREALESYIRRLHELEVISRKFPGVERAFAIQAGREVRVIVEPAEVSDAEAAMLAREISKKIEEELTYPGQIRVTVIRETRAIDYAK